MSNISMISFLMKSVLVKLYLKHGWHSKNPWPIWGFLAMMSKWWMSSAQVQAQNIGSRTGSLMAPTEIFTLTFSTCQRTAWWRHQLVAKSSMNPCLWRVNPTAKKSSVYPVTILVETYTVQKKVKELYSNWTKMWFFLSGISLKLWSWKKKQFENYNLKHFKTADLSNHYGHTMREQ